MIVPGAILRPFSIMTLLLFCTHVTISSAPFDGLTGQFRGWSGSDTDEDAVLRKAKLSGRFPSPLPPNSDEISWDVAKMWEDELEQLQVKRPSTIEGIDGVADVDAILRAILSGTSAILIS